MRNRPDVLVIGAGVIGLSTAVSLAEAGWAVRVVARHQPEQTTSASAGAIWGPYLVADERILRWSELTWSVLSTLAQVADSGVRLVHGLEAGRGEVEPPAWATMMDGFKPAGPHELPVGFAAGWWYTAPVVDMPVYLAYLSQRLGEAGGRIETGTVATLADAAPAAPVIVNCTGVAARELVPDGSVQPVRGQLVVVDNPGIDWFFVDIYEGDEQTCFLPHGEHVVLGGTVEPGRTGLAADPATAAAIVRRCAVVEPALAKARVRGHRVGLRPYRPRVRLELAEVDGRPVVHNYGHGGAGVTVSWGCAREVLRIVGQL